MAVASRTPFIRGIVVGDDEVVRKGVSFSTVPLPARRPPWYRAPRVQQVAREPGHGRLVVDDEHASAAWNGRGANLGSEIALPRGVGRVGGRQYDANAVPRSRPVSTTTYRACSCTMPRTTARPMPVPLPMALGRIEWLEHARAPGAMPGPCRAPRAPRNRRQCDCDNSRRRRRRRQPTARDVNDSHAFIASRALMQRLTTRLSWICGHHIRNVAPCGSQPERRRQVERTNGRNVISAASEIALRSPRRLRANVSSCAMSFGARRAEAAAWPR